MSFHHKVLGADGVNQLVVGADGSIKAKVSPDGLNLPVSIYNVPPTLGGALPVFIHDGDGAARLPGFSVAARTGSIAAAAAAGAAVFAMRNSPTAIRDVWIESVRLRWTTTTAFTTAVSATRSIVISRGSGAAASGGTAISAPMPKTNGVPADTSMVAAANGGDVRVSTTGALTQTGVTWEAVDACIVPLGQVGAAGAFYEMERQYKANSNELVLGPGELIAVRVGPTAMDAAGVWNLAIEISWRED